MSDNAEQGNNYNNDMFLYSKFESQSHYVSGLRQSSGILNN
jgi:hypothetical protein